MQYKVLIFYQVLYETPIFIDEWHLMAYSLRKIYWTQTQINMNRLLLPALLILSIGIQSLSAQTPYPENAWEKVHQFDFWLGKWEVYDYETDSLLAHSYVESILDSIGIQEHYTDADGSTYSSTSLNKYNFSKDKWEQYYLNNQGLTMRFLGNLDGNTMILENKKEFKNRPSFNKLSWELMEDGSVRHIWLQRWEHEEDWRTVFDGLYRRVEEPIVKKE